VDVTISSKVASASAKVDDADEDAETEVLTSSVAPLTQTDGFVSVIKLPDGYGLLPITLSISQVCSWTGLGKSKTQELINSAALATAKVDGRTLVLTSSVIALIERNRVMRDR
jgi:hypothetical protein